MVGSASLLSTFDVESIAPEALLFQTGYLTIRATESRGGRTRYRLGYPNREVFQSLNESLLAYLTRDSQRERNGDRLYDLLMAGGVAALKDLFHAFFASIPYEWYTGNDLARFEGYYASVSTPTSRRLWVPASVWRTAAPAAARTWRSAPAAGSTCSSSRSRSRPAREPRGAIENEGLRRQVPRPGRARPPGRGGVQQRVAQRGGVRPRNRVTRHGGQGIGAAYHLPVALPTWARRGCQRALA